MQVHHLGLDNFFLDASATTIGSFDGIHLGHQNIFAKLVEYSKTYSIPSVVVTFFPHPFLVVHGSEEPIYLTLPDEKAALLFDLGIDHVVTIPFTRELASYSPFQFMDLLNQHLHIKHLVVGEDFALGKNRKGNPEILIKIGQTLGYDVDILYFKVNPQDRVSSSKVRDMLKEGNIELANQFLGRQYSIPIQISNQPANPDVIDEFLIIYFKFDNRQMLPATGYYEAFLDIDPDNHFSVIIKPKENSNSYDLIGFIPSEMRHYLINNLSARLVFHSGLSHIPENLDKLQNKYPEISKIIALSNGA